MENPTITYISALQDINKALLFGLETAVKTMKVWDGYPEDRRAGLIHQIEGLIEKGKELHDLPVPGPAGGDTVH